MRQLPSDWSDASTNRDASTNQGPPKAVSKQQKLEGVRKDSPLESLEKAWTCKYHNFGLLASRTVR